MQSERGWERQDAAASPSVCTAYGVECVDFVGVFLRASASSWGNYHSQVVVVSISLTEYESEQNVSSALCGGLTDTQPASEIAGVFCFFFSVNCLFNHGEIASICMNIPTAGSVCSCHRYSLHIAFSFV